MVCTLPVQLVVRASSGPVKDFTKIPASRPRKKLPNGGKQQ
jgi:hypothetical protein